LAGAKGSNILLSYWYRLYNEQTRHEEALEREVAKLGVRYRTQHPFIGQKAFADFYFPDHRLIVEVDDPSHEKPEKIKKDLQRTKLLEAKGLQIVRFTNRQIAVELSNVVATVKDYLEKRSSGSL